jgi:ApaG protein
MVTKTSNGVEITVEVHFQPDYSDVQKGNYFFSYKISIHNLNPFSIQLLKRHWYIFDSNAKIREVEGEGVVGEQPVIEPNREFHYMSGCDLHTEIGKMQGNYEMINLNNNQTFVVAIPAFQLIYPFKNN